jgi:prepilin-type N-terminal cleavage/methylation domain-containing protein
MRLHILIQNKSNSGFTLVEMAVALVIVGLLLGGMSLPLLKLQEQTTYSDTRRQLNEIRDTLLGYGMSHGYLPCPAVSAANGAEDRNAGTGACNKRVGFLPWAELSIPKLDSWGQLYRYSVTNTFSNSSTKISMTSPGDITVQNRDSSGALTNITGIPAVVLSFGKSAAWGTTDSGSLISDSSATNIDEDVNGNDATGTNFVTRDINSNTASTGGEFDDLVVWIPASLYINRMVAATQLP